MDALLTTTPAAASNGDLTDFYWSNLYIQDKRDQLLPLTLNRAQQHFLANRTGRDLVLKARQMGLSTVIQADQFVAAITTRTRCATLAHDDAGTMFLRRMADRFWVNLPEHVRPPRGLDNATTTSYPTTGSEIFIATAGSKNKGRAGTYTRVHGSEVAFWPDAASVMAGLMQGVPDNGVVVLESTPNGASGWFYERCMEALDGDSTWALHFLSWWWDDGYRMALEAGEMLTYTDEEAALATAHSLTPEQIKWRRAKQKELGRLFPQEYPEDPQSCFLLSGVGYFGDLSDAFTAALDATPQAGHRYVAGLDFAQTTDYTVLSIIDATTMQQVMLLRMNRLPWEEMRRRVIEACRHYNVTALTAETNSMGSTNIEALRSEMGRAGVRTQIVPFTTTNISKAQVMAGLHSAIHEGGLKLLPDAAQRREFVAFTSKQTATGAWSFSAPAGEHDDTVIASALAWDGIIRGAVSLGSSIGTYA